MVMCRVYGYVWGCMVLYWGIWCCIGVYGVVYNNNI